MLEINQLSSYTFMCIEGEGTLTLKNNAPPLIDGITGLVP